MEPTAASYHERVPILSTHGVYISYREALAHHDLISARLKLRNRVHNKLGRCPAGRLRAGGSFFSKSPIATGQVDKVRDHRECLVITVGSAATWRPAAAVDKRLAAAWRRLRSAQQPPREKPVGRRARPASRAAVSWSQHRAVWQLGAVLLQWCVLFRLPAQLVGLLVCRAEAACGGWLSRWRCCYFRWSV
jgi:hypothetical protein